MLCRSRHDDSTNLAIASFQKRDSLAVYDRNCRKPTYRDNTNRILKFGKQGETYSLSTCYVDWLYHDTAPNAIQQGLCRRCDPSDCSTKQWSPQRHPEPPWWHEGVASGWKCPQMFHKSPDQYDGNGMNRFMMFHKSSSPSKSPRQHKKLFFYKCKDSNQFLLCLKHSGSKYFCTNFSIRGALRGFNSLGFITLKDEITGKSRETWCNYTIIHLLTQQ